MKLTFGTGPINKIYLNSSVFVGSRPYTFIAGSLCTIVLHKSTIDSRVDEYAELLRYQQLVHLRETEKVTEYYKRVDRRYLRNFQNAIN